VLVCGFVAIVGYGLWYLVAGFSRTDRLALQTEFGLPDEESLVVFVVMHGALVRLNEAMLNWGESETLISDRQVPQSYAELREQGVLTARQVAALEKYKVIYTPPVSLELGVSVILHWKSKRCRILGFMGEFRLRVERFTEG
jgi:hypothetical protein